MSSSVLASRGPSYWRLNPVGIAGPGQKVAGLSDTLTQVYIRIPDIILALSRLCRLTESEAAKVAVGIVLDDIWRTMPVLHGHRVQ